MIEWIPAFAGMTGWTALQAVGKWWSGVLFFAYFVETTFDQCAALTLELLTARTQYWLALEGRNSIAWDGAKRNPRDKVFV